MDTAAATTTADLTAYRLVHRAIRRGAADLAAAAVELDPADRVRSAAVARWGNGYLGELHCHHTIEDEVCFPALVERVPAAADLVVRTDRDHEELDDLIGRLEHQFAALDAGTADPGAPDGLSATLARLSTLMDEHLDFEDADVLPLFEQHFTGPEYEELDARAVKVLGMSKQALFTVPFLLSQTTPAEFTHMWTGAPAPFKVLYRLSRAGYARRTTAAFGPAPAAPTEALAHY